MFRIIKQLLLVPVFVALVALGFLFTNQTNHAYAFKTDGVCFWNDQGKIECKYETWIGGAINGVRTTLDKLTPSPSEIPIIGSAVKFDPTTWDEQLLGAVKGGCGIGGSDCDDYFYHPKLSEEAGYPIFGGGQGNHPEYLHFVSQNPVIAYTSNSPGKLDPKKLGNADDPNWMPIAKIDNANKFGDKDMCGIMKPAGGCKIDGGDGMPGGTYSGPPLDTASFKKTIESIQSLNAFKKACEKEAPLGFITCPIFNAINSAISSLIGGQGVSGQRDGLLISFLEFSPLNAQDSTQNNILPQIVSSIVSIANLFYVVIFLILIFSSTLPFGLDNYTIKKTFPKFIAAVIMTQFSYLICGVIIDFFNLLGNIVPNLIFALPLGLDFEAQGISGLSAGLQTVFASGPLAVSLVFGFFLLLILMFVALIAIIVAFVYMVLRYLILFILVLLAPLAFASWVLPGTDRFFKAWWKNFIRLNAMFPMITGLIAVSIMLSRVLLATDETNAALKLVALFIPIVALFAIPRTLKWTSDGMNALAGKVLGGTASKMPGGGKALGGKTAKLAASKAKEAGKNYVNEQRTTKASELFGRGGAKNEKKAAILMGKMPNQKGIVKASDAAARAEKEKADIAQAALSMRGIRMQGLKVEGGDRSGLITQLMNERGLKQAEAETMADSLLSARSEAGQAAYDLEFGRSGNVTAAEAARQATLADLKDGSDLYGVELGKIASGRGSSLLGVKAGDKQSQVPAVAELAKNGSFDKIHAALETGGLSKDVMMKGIQASFSDVMSKAPDLVKGPNGAFDAISADKALSLDKETVKRLVAHAQSAGGAAAKANLDRVANQINQDPKLLAALDPKVRDIINNSGVITTRLD